MNWLSRFIDVVRRSRQPLSAWFQVQVNQSEVSVSAQPPGRDQWHQTFLWEDVVRIIFEGNGGLSSDGVYVFTSKRPESYVIPTEAKGGDAFVEELIRRGYFASEKFRDALLKPRGMYCWPEDSAKSAP